MLPGGEIHIYGSSDSDNYNRHLRTVPTIVSCKQTEWPH